MEFPKQKVPSLEELFNDFNHPNPLINQEAYLNMLRFWREESMNLLLQNLDHKDIILRRKSINALGLYGESIIPRIFKIFDLDNTTMVRISCLKILLKIVVNENISFIENHLKKIIESAVLDQNSEVILALVTLLRQLGDPAIPYLLFMCNDPNVLKAKASISAISEMHSSKILREILREIILDESKDFLIIQAAKEALNVN